MSFTFQWVSGTTWPIALISCCSRWTDADDSREGCVWFSPFSGDHTDGAPKHVQSSSYFRFFCAVQPITLGGSWAASCGPPSLPAPLPWYGFSSPVVWGHFLGEAYFCPSLPYSSSPPSGLFPGGTVVKNLPASPRDARDMGSIPELERPPGVGNSDPPSLLAWKIPWTEEPGGLESMWSQRVGHDWTTNPTILQGVWRCHLIGKEEREVEREVTGAWVGRNGKFRFGRVECDMPMNHVQWASHGDSSIGESGAQGSGWSEVA